ncbi:DUF932 domain-containing protein [Desulfogranum marinum]|uniref:DUF932 domain-containing protein n=1 Tax=Desulfogranum marinum TaxID=453220 RepID=UPI001962C3E2|nr:DUF932 domain-containing protein [Desulfogranum marinum]MBM9514264.1 DUF932 domain-containing protein [Desulfogranum marinum]
MTHTLSILSNDQIIEMAPAAGAWEPIDGVSSRYSFVPTVTAVDLLRDAGWQPIAASQSGVRKAEREGYQKHLIRFAQPDLIMRDERIDLLLYNSHDRGCSFRLMAGIYRFVCSNGLVVGDEYANFRHKHIGFSPDEFMQSAVQIAGAAGEIAGQMDEFKQIELAPEAQGIFAEAAHSLVYDQPEAAPIQPNALLAPRRSEDRGNDVWTAYNRIHENVINGGIKGVKVGDNGRRRKVTTRPVKALDKNLKLNQALWVLTQRMAELAQGIVS